MVLNFLWKLVGGSVNKNHISSRIFFNKVKMRKATWSDLVRNVKAVMFANCRRAAMATNFYEFLYC